MDLNMLSQMYGQSGVVTSTTPRIGTSSLTKEEQEMILAAQAAEEQACLRPSLKRTLPRQVEMTQFNGMNCPTESQSSSDSSEDSEESEESESECLSESEAESETSEESVKIPVSKRARTRAIGSSPVTIPDQRTGMLVEALSASLSERKRRKEKKGQRTSKDVSNSKRNVDLEGYEKPSRQQTEDVDFISNVCEALLSKPAITAAKRKLELQVALSLSEAALEGVKAAAQTLQASSKRLHLEQQKLKCLHAIQRSTLSTMEGLGEQSPSESLLDDIKLSYTGSLVRQEQVSLGPLRNSLQWLTGKLEEISGSTGMKVTKILSSTTLDQMV